ncbi:hypothetical protein QHH03_28240, partial [Aphanizomenon sp. 202]|nr:hypothetical protein [Aphanizomenon sp. 202]
SRLALKIVVIARQEARVKSKEVFFPNTKIFFIITPIKMLKRMLSLLGGLVVRFAVISSYL